MDLQIINIAASTENNKEIKKFTHKSKYKNTICGDQIEIRLIVKKQKILDFPSTFSRTTNRPRTLPIVS